VNGCACAPDDPIRATQATAVTSAPRIRQPLITIRLHGAPGGASGLQAGNREPPQSNTIVFLAVAVSPSRRLSGCAMPMTSSTEQKIRVVVAKPGLDGHDRGAKIIARALRDAGMEVIYTGLHQTPEQIVETVIQEDADAVGLSILSGAHMTLVPRILELLREQGVNDVVVTVGGTIPAEDVAELKALGVAEVFTPGASTQQAIDFIRGAVRS
jgi:methylmalonyl-CoA mutase C-terminal domain/subunit